MLFTKSQKCILLNNELYKLDFISEDAMHLVDSPTLAGGDFLTLLHFLKIGTLVTSILTRPFYVMIGLISMAY